MWEVIFAISAICIRDAKAGIFKPLGTSERITIFDALTILAYEFSSR